MNKLAKIVFAGGLLLTTTIRTANGQDATHSSTLILGAGGEQPTRNIFGASSGPAFSGTYEFRIMKFLAVEGGVISMLPQITRGATLPVYGPVTPGGNLYGPTGGYVNYTDSFRSRSTLIPFGLRGILPLAHNRLELFGGFGGAHVWNSAGPEAWLMQASVGGRVALDSQRRFWLGTTGRFFTNSGFNRQQWITYTVDVGIRFGR